MRWPFPDGELGTATALGAVTDRSVRLWLRAPHAATVPVRLLIDGRLAAETAAHPDPDHDAIDAVTLQVDPPTPQAPFVVEAAGQRRIGKFAPAPAARVAYSFAFGSCHQPFINEDGRLSVHGGADLYPAMGRLMQSRSCRFSIFLGDQMYSDGVEPINLRRDLKPVADQLSDRELVETYRHVYRGYFQQAGFRQLLEEWPAYLIWDDHEIYDGAGSLVHRDTFDLRLLRAAEAAYREYQHLRNPGARLTDRAPYDYSFWFGDAGFFVLDLRGCRDYRSGVLMGARQWERLEAFLREATDRVSDTVFIVASIPVTHFPDWIINITEWRPALIGRDIRDRWSAEPFRQERHRLLEHLFDWQTSAPKRQVVILSGDVHSAAAFRITRPSRRPSGVVWQWTSSPLTTPTSWAQHLGTRITTRLVNFSGRCYHAERRALLLTNNFGLVDLVPLENGGHQVTLSLFGFDQTHRRLFRAARVIARPGEL